MNQILYSGKPKKRPIILLVSIVVLIIILIISLGFGILNLFNDKILKGVVVANVDVSNMTKDEAVEAVNRTYYDEPSRNLILTYEDYSVSISGTDVGFGYTDAGNLIEEAYAYGRDGNILKNNFTVLKSYMNAEKRIETEESINSDKLMSVVKNAISSDNAFSKDDHYEVSDGKLIFTKGTEGRKIDYEKLEERVLDALKSREMEVEIPIVISEPALLDIDKVYNEVHTEPINASFKRGETFEILKEVDGVDFDKEEAKSKYLALENGQTAEIELKITKPEIKIENLGDVLFENTIATYRSEYDISDKARVTNLQIAANKCNNVILYPGDEFSYNKALGHRTTANGYKVSNSFAGGKVVQTVGGGICQVSSTLYNAALRAGLTITDRTAHGLYVKYVPQSTDATVVDNSIDFKFRNDRKYPVKIVTTCENGVVKASILGFKDVDEPTIDIEVKILETIQYTTEKQNDSSMKQGTTKVVQQPVNGYVSESYKIYYKDGKEISKELISKDRYAPTNEIIKVGTKVESTPVIDTPEVIEITPILPPGWDSPESGY